jgi:allantoin racemase
VTTLERSRVPIEILVQRYGTAGKAKVRAADISVLSLEDEQSDAHSKLKGEIEHALLEDRAEAIILGCAGMADLAQHLSREFGLTVIDGVTAAVKQAETLVAQGLRSSKRDAYVSPLPKPYLGMSSPFAAVDARCKLFGDYPVSRSCGRSQHVKAETFRLCLAKRKPE